MYEVSGKTKLCVIQSHRNQGQKNTSNSLLDLQNNLVSVTCAVPWRQTETGFRPLYSVMSFSQHQFAAFQSNSPEGHATNITLVISAGRVWITGREKGMIDISGLFHSHRNVIMSLGQSTHLLMGVDSMSKLNVAGTRQFYSYRFV